MARPLTKLLAHDCEFKWNNQCDISFQMLKDMLCSAPLLKYPDTNKPYTLYTDASKYGWAGVLTQSHTSTVDGKSITMDHPCHMSVDYFVAVNSTGLHSQRRHMQYICPLKNLLFILQDMNHPEK